MRAATTLAAGLLLAACAGRAAGELQVLGDPGGARRLLAEAAERGPVPLQVEDRPAWLGPERIAALAAEGVRGLAPRFAPQAPSGEGLRLVIAFSAAGPADRLCDAPPTPAAAREELQAAFCEGRHAVAAAAVDAAGLAPAATERLVWRLTARLFPDDYAETYGFDLFGWRVRLGGEVGF
ncbi:hypothetical protein SH611_11070 [Geminicoccaceae bacterium 1502E]|nr:hypothetical protein [Geminicoccaceae bacterium 1502E]